jgi:hypothetical protein
LTDPVAQYDHDEGVAVVGGFVYRADEVEQRRERYVSGSSGRHSATMGGCSSSIATTRSGELQFIGRETFGYSLLGFGRDAHGEIYALVNSTATPFGDTGLFLRLGQELVADLSGENENRSRQRRTGAGDVSSFPQEI